MLPALLVLALTASPSQPRAISMTGDAKQTFRPNQVVASFLLSASSRDQAGARKVNDEKLAKFVRACREAGVEQRHLTINEGGATPEYRGNEVTGYLFNRSVILTITDMARVDDALTAAVRNGGVVSGSVMIQNTEHQLYETKARVAAAQAARERAKGVTEALGAKLGLPINVNERTTPVESVPVGSFSVPVDGQVTSGFANREMIVTSQVTVQFDMEAPL